MVGGIWGEKTYGKIYGRKLQAHVRIRLSAKLVLAAARRGIDVSSLSHKTGAK